MCDADIYVQLSVPGYKVSRVQGRCGKYNKKKGESKEIKTVIVIREVNTHALDTAGEHVEETSHYMQG